MQADPLELCPKMGRKAVAIRVRPVSSKPWIARCRLCYGTRVNDNTATRVKQRRTTMVPVTTMEEIPVLSEQEREELLTSLKDAEARAKAGKAADYDPNTFKDRLIGIYRGGKP
jgi:hypothetical protein